jgi:hypothetical protein
MAILMAGFETAGAASAQPAVVLLLGSPSFVTSNSWIFLNATLHDETLPSPLSFVVFDVWKNTIGQTIAVSTCGVTMEGGETASCYAPVFNVPSGTYDVILFVVSVPYDDPVSLALTIQITL